MAADEDSPLLSLLVPRAAVLSGTAEPGAGVGEVGVTELPMLTLPVSEPGSKPGSKFSPLNMGSGDVIGGGLGRFLAKDGEMRLGETGLCECDMRRGETMPDDWEIRLGELLGTPGLGEVLTPGTPGLGEVLTPGLGEVLTPDDDPDIRLGELLMPCGDDPDMRLGRLGRLPVPTGCEGGTPRLGELDRDKGTADMDLRASSLLCTGTGSDDGGPEAAKAEAEAEEEAAGRLKGGTGEGVERATNLTSAGLALRLLRLSTLLSAEMGGMGEGAKRGMRDEERLRLSCLGDEGGVAKGVVDWDWEESELRREADGDGPAPGVGDIAG